MLVKFETNLEMHVQWLAKYIFMCMFCVLQNIKHFEFSSTLQ